MQWPQVWGLCKQMLSEQMTRQDFIRDIGPLRAVDGGNSALLLAPNPYVRTRVKQQFLTPIIECARKLSFGGDIRIQVEEDIQSPARAVTQADKRELAYGRLDEGQTFERFVVGECNQQGVEAASAMMAGLLKLSGSPCRQYNPLVFHGGVGFGKTHLLQAIGSRLAKSGLVGVGYETACRFKKNLVSKIRSGGKDVDHLLTKLSSLKVLLLDDISMLAGAPKCQAETLYLFDALLGSGAQIVVTCNAPPSQLKDVDVRLLDRLSAGLEVPIREHCLEVRAGILMQEAAERGRPLDDQTALRMASSKTYGNPTTGRTLTGWMNRLCADSTLKGQPITWQEASEILCARSARSAAVSPEQIQQVVADYFCISPGGLVGKKRSRSVAAPRHLAMYLCKTLTACSYPEIGEKFGGRNHTTVLYACRKMETLLEEGGTMSNDANRITAQLLG